MAQVIQPTSGFNEMKKKILGIDYEINEAKPNYKIITNFSAFIDRNTIIIKEDGKYINNNFIIWLEKYVQNNSTSTTIMSSLYRYLLGLYLKRVV